MNKSKLRRENKQLKELNKMLEDFHKTQRIFTPNKLSQAIKQACH